mmetsp:Transcript_13400/g.48770  ORF Transcript_13400/g.48770 Transcript_13400/m.48770 type:complete len:96 (+) Transcript_13400:1-288(+)
MGFSLNRACTAVHCMVPKVEDCHWIYSGAVQAAPQNGQSRVALYSTIDSSTPLAAATNVPVHIGQPLISLVGNSVGSELSLRFPHKLRIPSYSAS